MVYACEGIHARTYIPYQAARLVADCCIMRSSGRLVVAVNILFECLWLS